MSGNLVGRTGKPVVSFINHPHKDAITAALLSGEKSLIKIQKQFPPEVSVANLHKVRHKLLRSPIARTVPSIVRQVEQALLPQGYDPDQVSSLALVLAKPSSQASIAVKSRLIDKLRKHADSNKPQISLRAIELLARLPSIDLFQERVVNNLQATSESAQNNLAAKLRGILAHGDVTGETVDVSPTPSKPEEPDQEPDLDPDPATLDDPDA